MTPRGTKDILGNEALAWQKLEGVIRQLCNDFSISEVRTPIFEYTELFIKGTGETTDIVQKEMYTFLDKGNRSITLRPEGTPGAVRAYLDNKLYSNPQPTKLYYISSLFRYEKPEAGRMRQFHQFGAEFFGSYDPSSDAEVISLAYELLSRLNIKNTTLYLNSLGGTECRKKYNAKIKQFLAENAKKLCPQCKERSATNPLRVLDCKVDTCKSIVEQAPSILECLGDECLAHFEKLQVILTEMGIPFKVNPKIVRGLDYYTRTVFEFICDDLGSQSTICGGGRYDTLIESYEGQPTGAVGFGMGLERVLLTLLNQQPSFFEDIPLKHIFIGYIGEKGYLYSQKLAYLLRKNGVRAESETLNRSVKAQLKYANKIGAKFSVIIGDDEVANGKCKLKNMETGEAIEAEFDALVIKNIIKN